MPTWSTLIAGVEREYRLGSFNVQEVLNGVKTGRFSVVSELGAYRPALGAEVSVLRDAVKVYGGYINKTSESGADKQPIDTIETLVDCDSYDIVLERRFIYETIASGSTLKQALQQIEPYFTPYGISLHASQANGPTLTTDVVFDGETGLAAIQRLSQLTGYAGGIDYDKKIRLFAFGEIAAPFNVVDGDGNHVGDVQVDRSRGKYFNRVIVKYGTGILDKTDTFTGDGVEDTFPLTYRLVYQPQVGYGYVTNGATNYETLDLTGFGATWEYDPVTNSIVRVAGAPANLNAISITYPALFPALAYAEDASEISANGLFETVIEYPNVFDKAEAEALAATHLSQFLEILTTVKFDTHEHGLHPGQTITLTIADRNVSGSHLITEVKPVNPNNMQDLRYSVIAVDSETFRGSFRQLYRDWLGGGAKTANVGNADVSHGGGAPHPPQRAIQSFRDGQFYGASELLHDWDGGGATHGVTVLRSLLGITTNDDRHHIALINTTNGAAKAFTMRMIDGGDTLIEQDGGEDVHIDVYGGGALQLSGTSGRFRAGEPGTAGSHLRIGDLVAQDSVFPGCQRKTTSFTLDAAWAGGGMPEHVVFLDSSTARTVTLPAVTGDTTSLGATDSWSRQVTFINIGTADWTLAPASGNIEGASSYVLKTGQRAIAQAFAGTGSGWFIAASHGIFRTASVTLTDAQIKALPTTPITIIPAPGLTGLRHRVWAATFLARMTGGAVYTNIDATYAALFLHNSGDQTQWVQSGVVDDSAASLTRFTALLGASAGDTLADSTSYLDVFSGGWGVPNVQGTGILNNTAIAVAIDNNGSGNLTGGNAVNTLKITVLYTTESL